MDIYQISEEIKEAGISLNLATSEVNLTILTENYSISELKEEIIADIKSKNTIEDIKNNPIIALYRQFYWKYLKIDPTKIRPASEALIRRILSNKKIPNISPMVDAYNWASIKTHIPMGAYDLEKISPPFKIRFSYDDERFLPLGRSEPKILKKKVLVNAEREQIICQYPYKDAAFSCVKPTTRNILLVAYGAPGISKENLFLALKTTKSHLDWLKNQGIVDFDHDNFNYFSNY